MNNKTIQDIARATKLRDDLYLKVRQLDRDNGYKPSPEMLEAANLWGDVKDLVQEIEGLVGSIENGERVKSDPSVDEATKKIVEERAARSAKSLESKLRSVSRLEKKAPAIFALKIAKPPSKGKIEEEKEKQKAVEEKEKQLDKKFKKNIKDTEKAVDTFNKKIPDLQQKLLDEITDQIKGLDLKDKNIAATVKNLSKLNSIKNRLNSIILNPDYVNEVKEFAKAMNDLFKKQGEYWKEAEGKFKPRPLLKAIRTQAITDTVAQLTTSGIGTNVSEQIIDILKRNITTGGSYAKLTQQLRGAILTTETDGLLSKYAKQITNDSINQYNAQYTQIVSSDLGFEWFAYQGSDIKTTRPFCDAMTDIRYFHITEIPRLLRAENLYYTKDGEKTKVPIYDKTKLPHGMIPGTNAANFQINRGGYNCGHQIRPVSERLVKIQAPDIFATVSETPAYKAYKGA